MVLQQVVAVITPLTLSRQYCLDRQKRIRSLLERRSLDRAVFVSRENIQYLTGFRPHRLMQAAVCIDTDGECTLAAPNQEPSNATFDRCVTFEAQWCATLRQEQLQLALTVLSGVCSASSTSRVGIEGSLGGLHLDALVPGRNDALADVEADLWSLRRRKDPDELLMIQRAIDCTEAMYNRAREIIEPGITELVVYNQLHAAAVEIAGEPLTALGNDFQCCSPGGPPRDRIAEDGELFILDLGPAYRGYYADNCRTIAVNGRPTDQQQRAWQAIVDVLTMVEQTVKPGVSCGELFQRAQTMLDAFQPGAFPHHLGHGFGLYPHEAPHLNSHWDDVFEEGDCFTAEPGLYTDALKAGIRLEQNYRVTVDGAERLTNFTLDL